MLAKRIVIIGLWVLEHTLGQCNIRVRIILCLRKENTFLRLFIARSSHPTDFSPQFRLRPLNHDRIVTKGRNVITGAIRGNKLIEDAAS